MTEALRLLLSAIRAPRYAKFNLHHGDCLDVLRSIPDASVDSVVTDPPYGLSFMGKKWDYDVPSEAIWRECLRVLKPGGHLLAFAGTRTQHRMAVRIEDAGFEIRDLIAWVYSTGFPKSHNLDRSRGEVICGCDEENIPGKPSPECEMRSMRNANVPTPVDIGEGRREVLQPGVPQSRASATGRAEFAAAKIRLEQPGMEGRSDVPKEARQLRAGEVRQVPVGIAADGAERWLRDGTPTGDGAVGTPPACPPRVRPSSGSRPAEQQQGQSRTVALQSQPQNGGAWPHCARCGKPRVLRGLGTALKPALEPITVARKPLARTVAENVLQWGCGGLNIDGCRVATGETLGGGNNSASVDRAGKHEGWRRPWMEDKEAAAKSAARSRESTARSEELGRWPANLIHDGSGDVLAGFPDSNGSGSARKLNRGTRADGDGWGMADRPGELQDAGTGSAARFFKQFPISEDEQWQDLNLPQENANIAALISSPQRKAAVSALVLAVNSALPEGLRCLDLWMAHSTSATGNELKRIAETVTQAIRSIDSRFWLGSQPARLSLSLSLAASADIQRLTDTTTITINHWKSNGSADPVIFNITRQSLEVGAKDYEPSTANRFMYCAKASKKDRDEGLDGFAERQLRTTYDKRVRDSNGGDSGYARRNQHPTVKPTDLMRYLARLVTPPGGVVLDPFMGSGSTGKAAMLEGFRFIGIERDEQYMGIARARIGGAL